MSRYSDLIVADGGSNLLGLWPSDAAHVDPNNPTIDVNLGQVAQNAIAAGGVLLGGATGPGELTATDFDGTDDRLTTAWTLRRNLISNPVAGAGATTGWTNSGLATMAAITLGSGGAPATPLAGITTGFHVVSDSAGDDFRFDLSGLTVGQTYQVSVYVYLVSRTATNLELRTTDSFAASMTTTTVGSWVRLSISGVAAVTTERFRLTQNGAGGIDYYATAAMFENAAALGAFFLPGLAADPDAAWEGTAHASVVGKGPYALGGRTFEALVYRDVNSAVHTIFSGDGAANNPFLRLASGSSDVVFSADSAGASVTWAGAGKLAEWFHVMAHYNGVNAKLLINGELISSQAYTATYRAGRNLLLGATGATTNPHNGRLAYPAIYAGDQTATAGVHWNEASWQLTRGPGPAPWYTASG